LLLPFSPALWDHGDAVQAQPSDPTQRPCLAGATPLQFERQFKVVGGKPTAEISPTSLTLRGVNFTPFVEGSAQVGTLSFDDLSLRVQSGETVTVFDFAWQVSFIDPDPQGDDDEFLIGSSTDRFQVPGTDLTLAQAGTWQGTFSAARWKFCLSSRTGDAVLGMAGAAGGAGVWVLRANAEVSLHNATGQQPITPFPVPDGIAARDIAGDATAGGGVWVLGDDRTVTFVTPLGQTPLPFPISIPPNISPVRIASAPGGVWVLDDDRMVTFFNASGQQPLPFPITLPSRITPIDIAGDGRGGVWVLGDDRKVTFFSASGIQASPFSITIPDSIDPVDIAWGANGGSVWVLGSDHTVTLFNVLGIPMISFRVP